MVRLAYVLALVVVAVSPVLAQGAAPTVTLQVTDEPVTAAAAAIAEQSGVQVGVPAAEDLTVSLDLRQASVEEAVSALAREYRGSWARFYLLEVAPPQTPYPADGLLEGLQAQRSTWFDSLTSQEQEEVVRQARLPRPADLAPLPGAGSFAGRRTADEGAAPAGLMFDPVRMLTLPRRTETVTLSLQDLPLPQALCRLTTACGFLIAAHSTLGGTLSLDLKDAPLEATLDRIAAAVNGKWRRVYLVSRPRPLSEAEQEQMVDKEMTARWNGFWRKSPEERARQIEGLVRLIGQVKALASVPGANGQPNQAAVALQQFGPRIFAKVMELSAASTPQQRAEIKPAIAALKEAISH